MLKQNGLEKLGSIFKEELWGRIEPKDTGISKFKILDDLFNAVVSDGVIKETSEECRLHLETHPDSITAAYLIGLSGYHTDSVEDTKFLRRLIDIFMQHHKWAVVELIAEKVLEYGENSMALRALAISLERLGRNKDAIPVWESLLKIERFDAEVARKLAYALMEDEPEKSIYYMKLSIEGLVKNRDFDEVPTLYNKLTTLSRDDISFFERIERLLVEAKQHELAATLLKTVLNKYKDEEHPDQSIALLKKIMVYRPDDLQARKDLIKLYRVKYGNHSQFEQFVKLSRLNNFRAPVKYAIQDFEKNIVFDVGNYAFHNSWGLGKIVAIDSTHITINFTGKVEHRMSIQMGLQSLKPVGKEHLYVMEYEDPEMIKSLLKDDFISFFEILIKSYGGEISVEDIKKELVPKYVEQKAWAKWWNRMRTLIKKDPLYGVSDKKKDTFFLRDKPVTFSDELLNGFIRAESFSPRLDIAMEFVNNIEKEEGAPMAPYFIDYFMDETKGDSATKLILSYFILKGLAKYVDAGKLKLDPVHAKVIGYIKGSTELPLISMKISSYDYKKDLVNLIEESREDWPHVIAEFLYETPVRIHKYIINNLIRAREYTIINTFIERTIGLAKQYPEIFIWVARNLLSKTWDYDWLDYSHHRLIIAFFRLMNELKKIEMEGNRLKNMVVDILLENNAKVLTDIAVTFDTQFLGKIYDMFVNVSYIEQSHGERFLAVIKQKYPDFQAVHVTGEEDFEADLERLVVSQEGYDKMKAELERMANQDMVGLSRELAKVAELSADVRENVEYNALMEKQAILKMSISKLDAEMRRANVLNVGAIDTASVNVGTRVVFEDVQTGESNYFTILGPWDADFGKNILSYRSPIAKSLLGRKAGEEVNLGINDEERKVRITGIEKYCV